MEREEINYYEVMVQKKIEQISNEINKCIKFGSSYEILSKILKQDLDYLNKLLNIGIVNSKFDYKAKASENIHNIEKIEYFGEGYFLSEKFLKLICVQFYNIYRENNNQTKFFTLIYPKGEFYCNEQFLHSRMAKNKPDSKAYEEMIKLMENRIASRNALIHLCDVHCISAAKDIKVITDMLPIQQTELCKAATSV